MIALAVAFAALVTIIFAVQLATLLRDRRTRRAPPKMVDLTDRKRSTTIADFLLVALLVSFALPACGTTFAANAEKCTVESLPKAAVDEVPVVVAAAQKDPTAWAKEQGVLLSDFLPYAGCIAYAGYQAIVQLLSHGQQAIAGKIALDRLEVLARTCKYPFPAATP